MEKRFSLTKAHEEDTEKTKTGLTALISGLTGLIPDLVHPEKNPVHPVERLRVAS